MKNKILDVKNLKVQFRRPNGLHFDAVKNISFDVKKGEVVGLVGESGSGKSTIARAILGLVDHSDGHIKIGKDSVPNKTRDVSDKKSKSLASKVQMIFQDAKSSLNPKDKVFKVIVEGAKNLKLYEQAKKNLIIKQYQEFLHNHSDSYNDNFYKNLQVKLQEKIAEKAIQDNFIRKNKDLEEEYQTNRIALKNVKLKYNSDIKTLHTHYKIHLITEKNRRKAHLNKLKSSEEKNKFSQKQKQNFINDKKLYHDDKKMMRQDFVKKDLQTKENFKVFYKKFKAQKRFNHNEFKKALEQNKVLFSQKLDNIPSNSKSILATKWNDFDKKYQQKISKKTFYSQMVKDVLEKVSISPAHTNRYPGEFSGGQAQRIAIARTFAMNPELIIADEPISALDVSIQAQVINILKDLINKFNTTVLFIAHDLQIVRYISDRIIVIYKGELVEEGLAEDIYHRPVHPYTKTLLKAVPSIDDPDKISQSKPYFPELLVNFKNMRKINKKWFDVNEQGHKVFGTSEQVQTWLNL